MMKRNYSKFFIILILISILFVSVVSADNLDESQTEFNAGGKVGRSPLSYELMKWGQSIQADYSILTKVELLLSGHLGDKPSTPFIMEIRWDLDDPSSTQRTFSVEPEDIPPDAPSNEWIEFDIEDLELQASKSFYIVGWTDVPSYEHKFYQWYVHTNNDGGDRYPEGNAYISTGEIEDWESNVYDMCFKTYGYDNIPPDQATSPSPSDGQTNVDVDTDISWTCSDPDNDDLTYDVYFGTSSNPPLVSQQQASTSYDPGTMEFNTKYYWKIVAEDEWGDTSTGPIWDFTTEEEPQILSFSPEEIDFGSHNKGWQGSDTFEIWNSGGQTLTYSISESLSWISISPTSGSSTGEHDTITVTVSNTGSMSGYYDGYLYITSDGGSGSLYLEITITDPDLCTSTTVIDFGSHNAGWTGCDTFDIWNCGTGELTYSISESISWISVCPTGGSSTGEHDTITVTVSDTGSMSGYYDGFLSVSSNGGSQSIHVEIDIIPPDPVLSYSPEIIDFGNHYQGWTACDTFEIWNSGTGELTYTLSENIDWLSICPTSGSSTGEHDTITVSVSNTDNLDGEYSGEITISSNDVSGVVTVSVSIKPSAKWAIIAYLSCDDLNINGCGQDILNQMVEVGSEFGNLEIIALYDRLGNHNTNVYHVENDNLVNIPLNKINDDWTDEINTGDPNSLIDFSSYCVNNYPAEHYVINLMDHGMSWVGCCSDHNSDYDLLTLDDLTTSLQTIKNSISHRIEILFFNACLMNSIEVAYQIKPFVNYQAGSETITYSTSFDDEYIGLLDCMKNNPNINDFGLSMWITQLQHLIDNPFVRTHSTSTINLNSKIENLKNSIDQLAIVMENNLDDINYFDQIQKARKNCEFTFGPVDPGIEKLIDVKDFAEKIISYCTHQETISKAQSLIDDFDDAILLNRNTDSADFCNGLSIYFPDRADRLNADYLNGIDFVSDTNWDEFLNKYYDQMYGGGINGWDSFIKAYSVDDYKESIVVFGEDIEGSDDYNSSEDIKFTNWNEDLKLFSTDESNYYSVDIRKYPEQDRTWDFYLSWSGLETKDIQLIWDVSNIPYVEYSKVLLYFSLDDEPIDMKNTDSCSIVMEPGGSEIFYIKLINPPEAPQITGPIDGNQGEEYDYTFVSTDPFDQDIYYYVDWGDGTDSGWIGPYNSGEPITISHTWDDEGSFSITAKAKDTDDYESDWGILPVTMPYNNDEESYLVEGCQQSLEQRCNLIFNQILYLK